MKNSLIFKVDLEFANSITSDNDIEEVAANVARAIKLEAGGMGIAPIEGDTYLVTVRVTPQFSSKTVIEQIY